jgi:hypothetical protein
MRRAAAMFVLAFFSFSLIEPALSASDADATLPSCCRRDGEHRCGMSKEQTPGTQAKAAKCPSFPVTKGLPSKRSAATPVPLLGIAGDDTARRVLPTAQPDSLYLNHSSLANQKRGPPFLL